MSHTFNSTNDRTWLKDSHRKRSNRSVELGKSSIELLINRGIPVTYSNIAEISKEIDTEGKGIHSNTIRTNPELYEYYKKNSKTFILKENIKNINLNSPLPKEEFDFRKIDPNRNLDNTKRKYLKLSKKELVQKLIQAEQYIAENHSKWITNHFESFK